MAKKARYEADCGLVKAWRQSRRDWLSAFEDGESGLVPVSFREHPPTQNEVLGYVKATFASSNPDHFGALEAFPRPKISVPESLGVVHALVMKFADATRAMADLAERLGRDPVPFIAFERDLCRRPCLPTDSDRGVARELELQVEWLDRTLASRQKRTPPPTCEGRRRAVLQALPASHEKALKNIPELERRLTKEFVVPHSRSTTCRDLKSMRPHWVADVLKRTPEGDRVIREG